MNKKTQNQFDEEKYRLLIDNNPDAIIFNNKEGIITYASPAIEQILGYKPEELINVNPADKIHPDDVERAFGLFTIILKEQKKITKLQYRIKHKKGYWVWVEGVFKNMLANPYINAVI